MTKHCITCLACICMSIYFCTGCCRDICRRRAMLLWHRSNVSWIVVHCFWHEQPMKPYFHQPPLQLLGRTDQQTLALGLRLLILSRPARVKKTRWNAHGNANEYVPTAHQYIKSHQAFKWWYSFLSFKYYSRRKTGITAWPEVEYSLAAC